jgi:hypothetical protein
MRVVFFFPHGSKSFSFIMPECPHKVKITTGKVKMFLTVLTQARGLLFQAFSFEESTCKNEWRALLKL